MTYQKEIKNHFENIRKELFGEIEYGKWRNKVYKHILPKNKKSLNLLPSYRDKLEKYLEVNSREIKQHIYFHHLNSSQAMCLNFFFPLIEEKELDVILKLIGFDDEEINYNATGFEKESIIEKSKKRYRSTNFDFFIETVSGKKIFFEIKYTEQEFGKAKLDALHENKFKEVYKENLKSIKKEYHSSSVFLKNYQILRNLICISENSFVVFLYPNGNKRIKTQAETAKSKFITNELSNNLINLTWEKLLDYAEKNVNTQSLKIQFNDFRKKYKILNNHQ